MDEGDVKDLPPIDFYRPGVHYAKGMEVEEIPLEEFEHARALFRLNHGLDRHGNKKRCER